jgi:phosphatidylserine/phosphatidylglycerophosphate/cardiolipin synthase-like enzyme
MQRRLFILSLFLSLGVIAGSAAPAAAQDRDYLCDPGAESCRDILLQYIDAETKGIDVAFWFMEDASYTAALKRAWLRGVPVRVLMDDRANDTYPLNSSRLNEIKASCRTDGKCIPMRKRLTKYILHWKMMLFRGQGVVEFSGANYSADAWRPSPGTQPYQNYTDESILFTNEPSLFNSFATKFDDHWTNTTEWANYANVVDPLTRTYDVSPKDPSLNFPPAENYRTRAVSAYNAEKRAIDVIMYRITDRAHTDAIINALKRGIRVRLITEPVQYRDVTRLWDAWNVDRLYMAGLETGLLQVKMRAHAGLNHQKSVILYDQNGTTAGDQSMVIFGSSNWTSPSANGQVEHNLFTKNPEFIQWFVDQFERKWNNTGGVIENTDFVPLRPDAPTTPTPADGAAGLATTVAFKWFGGPWAHLYDLYIDTNSEFTTNPQVFRDLAENGSKTETSLFSYTLPVTLTPGTTYYWKVVGKTMALQTKTSRTFSFTTGGQAPPPPTSGTAEVVLYASKAPVKVGNWQVAQDSTAAGGARLRNPNLGAAKIAAASPTPADYFEMSFYAEAGKAYQLWLRGKADSNNWANDSVFVQFDKAVNNTGTPIWRIGTTSATEINLEDCNGCGVSSWGWQDNGYGNNVAGTKVYFATTGTQTLRVQVREDGLSIDQIVLSSSAYLTASPGTLKNDTKILAESDGTGTPDPDPDPEPTSPADIVLYASEAPIVRGGWGVESDTSAAGGAKLRHPNAGAGKQSPALANPVNFFELTFNAEAGKPYRIWIRGKADSNNWANDSLFIQFDRSIDSGGSPVWRIGTTTAAEYNLEDCSGCGLSNWGWQDNGWGIGVMGPVVYFQTTGAQTMRLQTREDGLSVDQVVLSGEAFLSSSPGSLKNDGTILMKTTQ